VAEQTWLESTEQLLSQQSERGAVHYVDLTAALAERNPTSFGPAPRRLTPERTVYTQLLRAPETFEKLGRGWFIYRPWGDVGDAKIQVSGDGGESLKKQIADLKEAAGATGTALDFLFEDETRRDQEAALREEAMGRARGVIAAGSLNSETVGTLLSEWSTCGGKKPGIVLHNRFAPAFIGIYVQKYREQVDLLDDWVSALREAAEDEQMVPAVLDTLWGRADLAFAGTILPTTVLHTLRPDVWFPWTDTLARGLRSALGVGSGRADGSGVGFLAYCDGVRDYLDREGLSPHLADAALTRESLQVAKTTRKRKAKAAVAFGEDGFALLQEIADTSGGNAEWFGERRTVYLEQVRRPLQALVERVAREVIQPVVNDAGLIGDDQIVVEPKRVMARINAQSARPNGSMYYPYLWAAFFPVSHERRQAAAQLFVTAHRGGLDIGMALDSGPDSARSQFAAALADPGVSDRLQRWLSSEASMLELRKFSLDGGPANETSVIESVSSVARLAEPDGNWSLVGRLSISEALEADSGDRIELAARALLPFFLLALTSEPISVIDRLGLSAEEVEEADEEETPELGYSLDQLQADTHLEKAWLQEVALAATFDQQRRGAPGQIVLYGPPGTGKTYLAERVALHLVDGDRSRVEVVQLHPAFSYEHLMEGYRPVEQDGTLLFRLQDGLLPGLLKRIRESGKRHVLVLDEMNRGDLPQILGELMYLLSRRGTDARVRLARSKKEMWLPDRLSIIGTMNTADRSIAHVDFALRRRFRFFRVQPSEKVIQSLVGQEVGPDWAAALSSLLTETNERLASVGRGFEVGHSYFLDVDDERSLQEVWDREILPSIEDWLDFDPVALRPFGWEATRKRLQKASAVVAGEVEASDDEPAEGQEG
jgi:hypothetical protein